MGATTKQQRAYRMPAWIKVGIGIFLCTFLVFSFITGKAWLEYRRADNTYSKLRQQGQKLTYEQCVPSKVVAPQLEQPDEHISPKGQGRTISMDFTVLTESNRELVAWLACDGTAIDYPVMHTDNNDYYLTHLYNGEANRLGSLFVDYRNTGLFTDKNTVIYGHNMRDGSMFNSLNKYKKQDFYERFPAITLYTPYGDAKIELFAGVVENGNFEFVKFAFDSNEDFLNYVSDLRAQSTFSSPIEVQPDNLLVTLCTCSYEFNNARYAVIGRLVWL